MTVIEIAIFALIGLAVAAYPFLLDRYRHEDANLREEVARAIRQAKGDFRDR